MTIAVLAAQAALSEYHRLEALKPQMLVFSCSGGKSKIRVQASLAAQLVKNPPAMQETQVQSLGWEDPLEKAIQYSCLENSMDRGAWQATVHGVT